jgi:hypothetical protein
MSAAVCSWRHGKEGAALVAQVDRQGCSLILSLQWPDKVGGALNDVGARPAEQVQAALLIFRWAAS